MNFGTLPQLLRERREPLMSLLGREAPGMGPKERQLVAQGMDLVQLAGDKPPPALGSRIVNFKQQLAAEKARVLASLETPRGTGPSQAEYTLRLHWLDALLPFTRSPGSPIALSAAERASRTYELLELMQGLGTPQITAEALTSHVVMLLGTSRGSVSKATAAVAVAPVPPATNAPALVPAPPSPAPPPLVPAPPPPVPAAPEPVAVPEALDDAIRQLAAQDRLSAAELSALLASRGFLNEPLPQASLGSALGAARPALSRESVAAAGLPELEIERLDAQGVHPAQEVAASPARAERDVVGGLVRIGQELDRAPPLPHVRERLLDIAVQEMWDTFYGGLRHTEQAGQPLLPAQVQETIRAAYPELQDNAYVRDVADRFGRELNQAAAFQGEVAAMPGWNQAVVPRLFQAHGARLMSETIQEGMTGDAAAQGRAWLLNADDVGMGKSIQFALALQHSGARRAMVVAPKLIADTVWAGPQGELQRTIPGARVVRGLDAALADLDRPAVPGEGPTVYVMNYEEFRSPKPSRLQPLGAFLSDPKMALQFLASAAPGHVLGLMRAREGYPPSRSERLESLLTDPRLNLDVLAMDEAHRTKERAGQGQSQQSEWMESAAKVAKSRVLLSATPLVNELPELSALARIASRGTFAAPDRGRATKAAAIDMRRALSPHMLRRRADDYLPLPPAGIFPGAAGTVIPVPVDDHYRQRVAEAVRGGAGGMGLVNAVRRINVEAKMDRVIELVGSALREGRKIMVVTELEQGVTQVLRDRLDQEFPGRVATVSGKVADEDRVAALTAFRKRSGTAGSVDILGATNGVVGEGITLFDREDPQPVDVLFVNLPDTMKDFQQVVGRARRFGQPHEVRVGILEMQDSALDPATNEPRLTLDGGLRGLIEAKGQLMEMAVGGQVGADDLSRLSRTLIESITNAPGTNAPGGLEDKVPPPADFVQLTELADTAARFRAHAPAIGRDDP